MATGTVKWFNDAKGFGFITPSEGGEDLFAHHTAIQMSGFKTLKEGQKVEFEVKRGPKGLQAAMQDADALRHVAALSFHSWRGWSDEILAYWGETAADILQTYFPGLALVSLEALGL